MLYYNVAAGPRNNTTLTLWLSRLLCLALLIAALRPAPVSCAPSVVASIAPLHSLVVGVMDGIGRPALIVQGYGSPHSYQMRPSDAAALQAADLVFWIGEPLETFLRKPLQALPRKARVVAMIDTPGLRLLANRGSGVWDAGHDEQHAPRERHTGSAPATLDPHIWLEPTNAKHLVTVIANELGALDPSNANRYRVNSQQLKTRIDDLDRELGAKLARVRGIPFIIFHDAFQYFEVRYGLRSVGAMISSPERLPGAKRVQALRTQIRELGVRCIFQEPQFESALIRTLSEGTAARVAVIDPLGAAFQPGRDVYFKMMQSNTTSIVDCLTG
jgi:zinc transport system substrate-binding protein